MTARKRLPPVKNTWTGILEAWAQCQDCGWDSAWAKNSLGQANQHARRTGHTVAATQTISVTYNKSE